MTLISPRFVMAGTALEFVLVHGMRVGTSASDETPLKSMLLTVWAISEHKPSEAIDPASASLLSCVQLAISAERIMVTPRTPCLLCAGCIT